jgi:hypothetical protein
VVDCNTADSEYRSVAAQLAEKVSASPELAAELDAAASENRVPVLPADVMRLYDRANTLLTECPFETCTGILAMYSSCLAGQAADAFGDMIRMCKNPPVQCQPFQ